MGRLLQDPQATGTICCRPTVPTRVPRNTGRRWPAATATATTAQVGSTGTRGPVQPIKRPLQTLQWLMGQCVSAAADASQEASPLSTPTKQGHRPLLLHPNNPYDAHLWRPSGLLFKLLWRFTPLYICHSPSIRIPALWPTGRARPCGWGCRGSLVGSRGNAAARPTTGCSTPHPDSRDQGATPAHRRGSVPGAHG